MYGHIFALAIFGLVSQVLSWPGYKSGQNVLPEKSTSSEDNAVNCSAFPGEYPGNIINSEYYLFDNGTLCCPEVKSCKATAADMERQCGDRGLVFEPCFHCQTCGKIKGEDCHGHQYSHGRCGPHLSCINKNGTILDYQYDDGICTDEGGPRTNLQPGERCAGKYGYLGTCESDSHCVLDQDKDYGVCIKYGKTMV